MRIAVFGAGAVGGYFGGRLAQAGQDVVFIARGDHLKAIRESGLSIESLAGDVIAHPKLATDDPAEAGPVDAVLLGVKAWQVKDAAAALRPMLGPDTPVVPLQNGVDAPLQIAEIIGPSHAVGGLCKFICSVTGPGRIQHVGADPYIAFGELDGTRSERMQQFHDAFSNAVGLIAEVPDNIQAEIWKKFILIASWSGVGSITRSPVGVFRQIPETRQMLIDAMREVWCVAAAHQIDLPESDVDATMAFIDKLPESGTASMQRDIMEGRPSELHEQSGAVVRRGSAVGVPTPIHSLIYFSLLPQEMKARGLL
ncbi:2-dehydropantoate 2-reductase (EC [Olavius algarvensis associated proteobacterium Delta 3]|nr:2-dehydropantoate 2-reductase (EC [Olavius algarvensis associated proteobacterium Delta 3]